MSWNQQTVTKITQQLFFLFFLPAWENITSDPCPGWGNSLPASSRRGNSGRSRRRRAPGRPSRWPSRSASDALPRGWGPRGSRPTPSCLLARPAETATRRTARSGGQIGFGWFTDVADARLWDDLDFFNLAAYVGDGVGLALVDAALQHELEWAARDHEPLAQLLLERTHRRAVNQLLGPWAPQNLQPKILLEWFCLTLKLWQNETLNDKNRRTLLDYGHLFLYLQECLGPVRTDSTFPLSSQSEFLHLFLRCTVKWTERDHLNAEDETCGNQHSEDPMCPLVGVREHCYVKE